MTDSGFLKLKSGMLKLLRTDLDPRLTYHSPAHTEDVLQQVERLAAAENITDERLLYLMRIAALFHDTGFLRSYKGHEEISCAIMRERVGRGILDESELQLIERMIMATKIPQSPATLPEMIICDADLDYLGRGDFERISNTLKTEFIIYGIIKDDEEWDRLQISFFNSHQYFTKTSIRERCPVKSQHLAMLKRKLVK
jgi:predicted metal-dependent HD superfamily phosphohydrolase